MGDWESAAVEAAALAAGAGVAAGVVDALQAAALVALAESDDTALREAARRTLGGALSAATAELQAGAETVLERLEDADAGLEVSDLAELVAQLGDEVADLARRRYDGGRAESDTSLYAPPGWIELVTRAVRHLKEARDLIDDGMPADSAAFELQAARDALHRALLGGS